MSSIFAGFGRQFDGELQAKIDAALAGKASQQDKVEDFLKSELKVDPSKLPLSRKQAITNLNTFLQERNKSAIQVNGTSLGIKDVTLADQVNQSPPCDQCGNTDTDVAGSGNVNEYQCYECEDANGEYYKFTVNIDLDGEVITARTGDKDWPEFVRAAEAILRDQPGIHTFSMNYVYYGDNEINYIVPDVNPDLKWYGTGMTLRLERHVIGGDTETVYAKVGGLFSDTDLVELATMQPITDTSGYRVIEVL